MKSFLSLFILISSIAMADTPPPNTVKAKMYSGDGNTSFTATGSALNVNIVGSSTVTANQGTAGMESWLAEITSSALPTNACQETGGHLASIDTKLTAPLAVSGTFWQATQPVSLSSLPALASGSNTIGNVNINGTVPVSGTITATNSANGAPDSPAPSQATQIGGSDYAGDLQVVKVSSSGLMSVDGSSVTQPVSADSLPLPAGASTSALQTTINNTLGSPFQAGGSIGNSSFGISGTLPAFASTPTFNLGTLNGAATAANQATEITSLGSIDTKTPALGQALAAGSVPVVLTASQLSTLTPLSSVTVSGTVTANAGTGTFTVDGSGHTQPVSGTFWQATQPISAAALPLPSGAATLAKQPALGTAGSASSDVITVQGITSMTALKVDGSGVTQPVSGTVTANIGTSGSLALDASVTGLQVSQGSTTSGQKGDLSLGAVTSAAPTYTTAQSNPLSLTTAGALRIDGSATTQPVSLTTLPALTAGSAIIGKVSIDQTTPGTTNLVALDANQSVNVAQINATTPLMGNGTTGTGSQRVTIASDNTAFTVNAQAKTPTALTVKQAALSIGTSAARLTNDGAAPAATRVLLIVQLLSTSTANCYLGSSGVTTTSTTRGVQLFAGQTVSFTNDAGDYYAICDATTQTIFVTEQE